MKKIVLALMLVAAIAFVAVGQEGASDLIIDTDDLLSTLTLGGSYTFGNDDIVIDCNGLLYVIYINEPDTVDAIYAYGREISLEPEPTLLLPVFSDEATFGDDYGTNVVVEMLGGNEQPPYIVRINNPNTVQELWIGGELVDVLAWKPNPITAFAIGIAFGAFICWLLL